MQLFPPLSHKQASGFATLQIFLRKVVFEENLTRNSLTCLSSREILLQTFLAVPCYPRTSHTPLSRTPAIRLFSLVIRIMGWPIEEYSFLPPCHCKCFPGGLFHLSSPPRLPPQVGFNPRIAWFQTLNWTLLPRRSSAVVSPRLGSEGDKVKGWVTYLLSLTFLFWSGYFSSLIHL